MSEHDQTQVSGQDSEEKAMEHGPQKREGGLLIGFVIGLIASVILGWLIWQPMLYAKKIQPFNFSHLAHTEEAGMSCDECHWYDDNGRFSGTPKAEHCLMCHTWSDRQNEDNEAETAFLEEFVTEDDELKKPLEWYSYSKQPDCVYFSHIAHVEMGGIGCEECHGDHGQTAELRPFYQNRITRYSRDVYMEMKMNDCADCHTEYDVPENNACFVCHK